MIDLQALHTVKHSSTTQTHLLASAKGGGQSVLAHATIHLGVEMSGGTDGTFLIVCHRNTSLTLSCHDRCGWHLQPSVRRPEWLDSVRQWSPCSHGIHAPCHSKSQYYCEWCHLGSLEQRSILLLRDQTAWDLLSWIYLS